MQPSKLRHRIEKKMPKLRNGSKRDLNPGFLDRESDMLPQCNRTPLIAKVIVSTTENCTMCIRSWPWS